MTSREFYLTLVIVICLLSGVQCLREEYKLLKLLLHEYDTAVRPVRNQSDKVDVKMGIALAQIRELDEKNQFLQVNAWFRFIWNDPHLTWNSSEFAGLQRLRIPSSRLWVPDIALYNSVDETKPATDLFAETNAIVSSDGNVLWTIPAMIKSSCKINVQYFPFDEQSCPLKFGSWTYDGFQLDLSNIDETADLGKYLPSGEWDLIGMPAVRKEDYYACCVEPYIDVTYYINIRRKPMFFTYNLVFPCVLLMGIGILVFCLPPESGEKVSLGVTVLLAMTVYQLLIAEAIPPTSEVIPLIGKFFGATIFLLSLSTAMTVIIMKLHFSGEHGAKVPLWLRKIVLVCLARVVRMHQHVPKVRHTKNKKSKAYGSDYPADGDASLLNHNHSYRDDSHYNMVVLNKVMQGDTNSPSRSYTSSRGLRSNSMNTDSRSQRSRDYRGRDYHPRDLHSCAEYDLLGQNSTYGRSRDYSSSNMEYRRGYSSNENSDSTLSEMLLHVRQLSEEIHQRHVASHTEEIYKSEWRMVALILDRVLLILFMFSTSFICILIFVNVPLV